MTEYTLVMDDMEVKNENFDESEIPGLLDSGFVCAVLKVVDGKIRYAAIDWDEYVVDGWKLPVDGDA